MQYILLKQIVYLLVLVFLAELVLVGTGLMGIGEWKELDAEASLPIDIVSTS